MDEPYQRARSLVRDVDDFPKPGVVFKDLTPLFADRQAFSSVVDGIVDHFVGADPDRVLGIEARGFIVAAPVAYRLAAGFVPARKKGKLPWETTVETYELEYGAEQLEVHGDACGPGDRVLVVDDVLATGGTARAATTLVERLGATVVGIAVVAELTFLGGREKLRSYDVHALWSY